MVRQDCENLDKIMHELRREWTVQLYAEWASLAYRYNLRLKKPTIQVVDLKGYWGSWNPSTSTISITERLIRFYSWDAVIEILRHEVAHQIVTEIFLSPDHTHGTLFRRAARMVGAATWASAAEADIESSVPGDAGRVLSVEDERLLKRVEKLLALATSNNEHEALLAMQLVQSIYQKHNIEKIVQRKSQDYIYHIINHKKKSIPQHQAMIATILNQHFFVDVVFSHTYDALDLAHYKVMEILGSRENVQMAEYVYHFLLNNLTLLWKNYKKGRASDRASKRSFFLGVLSGFNDKLQKQTEEYSVLCHKNGLIEVDGNKGQLMRKARLDFCAFIQHRHPKLRSQKWNASLQDVAYYNLGINEGRKLHLSKGIYNSNVSEQLLLR